MAIKAPTNISETVNCHFNVHNFLEISQLLVDGPALDDHWLVINKSTNWLINLHWKGSEGEARNYIQLINIIWNIYNDNILLKMYWIYLCTWNQTQIKINSYLLKINFSKILKKNLNEKSKKSKYICNIIQIYLLEILY